jgi:hypothetical protein
MRNLSVRLFKVIASWVVLALPLQALSAPPNSMNYQGRITKTD